MKGALIVIAAIILAGCKPSAEKAIELAKKEVSAATRDPDSSKFKNLKFIQKDTAPDGTISGYVCGQINGKNGFGAYSGFTPFMLEIKMKSKGVFGSSVKYSTYGRKIFSGSEHSEISSYYSICGAGD